MIARALSKNMIASEGTYFYGAAMFHVIMCNVKKNLLNWDKFIINLFRVFVN